VFMAVPWWVLGVQAVVLSAVTVFLWSCEDAK